MTHLQTLKAKLAHLEATEAKIRAVVISDVVLPFVSSGEMSYVEAATWSVELNDERGEMLEVICSAIKTLKSLIGIEEALELCNY